MITIVESIPVVAAFSRWTFANLVVLPWFRRTQYYTDDPVKAHYHIIPQHSTFNATYDLVSVFTWLKHNYAPWNDSTTEFVFFNFCDVLTDCHYFHVPFNTLPDEFNPASRYRRYMLVGWNGLSDGFDSGMDHCGNCFQAGRDVQLPTAENACGPLCGSDLATLRKFAVWGAQSPTRLLAAYRHVKSWQPRPHKVFWAGRVTGKNTADDVSGRTWFLQLYAQKPDWFVRATYNYSTDSHQPLDTSVLEMMRNSTFCYSPLGGLGGDTDRYLPALLTGCIPVMLRTVHSEGHVKRLMFPFQERLDWDSFAVVVDYADIPYLDAILGNVDIPSKRAHVHNVWRHLLYTGAYQSYFGETDADDVLHTLAALLMHRHVA